MALSGTITTTKVSTSQVSSDSFPRWLILTWSATQSIANNQSTVSWTLKASGTNANNYVKAGPITAKINGETVYSKTSRFELNSKEVLGSGKIVIDHPSAGGTKSVSVKIEGALYSSSVNCTADTTFTLDAIPRAASISAAPDFNDEGNPTITYSNPAGSAVTSLQACIANSTGGTVYVGYRDISKTGTSYTFSLTDAERNALRAATPNSNSLTVRFYVRTTIDGTNYLSHLQKTMSIVNANPVISASAVDTNSTTIALTGDNTRYIRYYSNVKVSMTATAQKSSTIASTSGAGTFNNVEKGSWALTATDSRGNSSNYTASGTLVSYVRLTCNSGNSTPDTSGNMTVTCSGNYFNGSFGAVANTLTVQYRYKVQGGSYGSWTNMTVTKSGNTYDATASISGLSYQQTYVFQTRATDKLATVSTDERTVRSLPIFHWGENDFVFEVPVTFNAGAAGAGAIADDGGSSSGNTINGDFNITGNLRLKGSGNYGNTLYFGDGSYAYIAEGTDDDLTIKSSDLNLNVSNFLFNNKTVKYGTWTPTLSSSAVSSYTVQQGWYQKLGSVVTIGWQVKANCNSGYQSTSISISGLPFTPAYDASGGGVCSGVYVGAGFNFECWVASTGNTITGRVQSCNNTSAANLSTSASGLFYRSGGGEITIGGTICYMTSD